MDNYLIGGNENKLYDGERVYAHDLDGTKAYGTLRRGSDDFYEWYVEYDDGEDLLVLDPKQLFKA